MDIETQVQMLHKAAFFSHGTNILLKDMPPTIFPSFMDT